MENNLTENAFQIGANGASQSAATNHHTMTDKEIEKQLRDEAIAYMRDNFPNGLLGMQNAIRMFIAGRKQSLSELAEAKEEIDKWKADHKSLLELYMKQQDELSSLKASLLKEVEDAFEAGFNHGVEDEKSSGYAYKMKTPNRVTYLNNLKERLNIQL